MVREMIDKTKIDLKIDIDDYFKIDIDTYD